MLESMIHNRRPTRAEASDVANAILDGTDAVMLSGETAVGTYPLESVRVMARIAERIESSVRPRRRSHRGGCEPIVRERALAAAACEVGEDLEVGSIVAFTMTGATARYVSQQRPRHGIYALTPDERTYRRLALVWGVSPVMFSLFGTTDEMIERGEARLLDLGLAEVGQTNVCVAGASTNTPGGTDMLKIHYFDGTRSGPRSREA
jgi:pyruvate kinase